MLQTLIDKAQIIAMDMVDIELEVTLAVGIREAGNDRLDIQLAILKLTQTELGIGGLSRGDTQTIASDVEASEQCSCFARVQKSILVVITNQEVHNAHTREYVDIDTAYLDWRSDILRSKRRSLIHHIVLYTLQAKHQRYRNRQKYRQQNDCR